VSYFIKVFGALFILLCHLIAVEKAINNASNIGNKSAAYQRYISASSGKSNSEAREIAKDIIGESVFWDWDRVLQLPDISAVSHLTSL
jgi:hypothetical protein